MNQSGVTLELEKESRYKLRSRQANLTRPVE